MPREVESTNPETLPDGNRSSTVAYRCKKCRRVVAVQDNIVNHNPGEGMTAFQWQKRRSGNNFDKPDDFGCSSIFIEPLKWMKAGIAPNLSFIVIPVPFLFLVFILGNHFKNNDKDLL